MEKLFKIKALSLKGSDQEIKIIGKNIILFESDLIFLVGNPIKRVLTQCGLLAFESKEGSKIILRLIKNKV